MGANDTRGGVIFDPSVMIRRIYVKLHISMLHTNIEALAFVVSHKKIVFMYFPLKAYGR